MAPVPAEHHDNNTIVTSGFALCPLSHSRTFYQSHLMELVQQQWEQPPTPEIITKRYWSSLLSSTKEDGDGVWRAQQRITYHPKVIVPTG